MIRMGLARGDSDSEGQHMAVHIRKATINEAPVIAALQKAAMRVYAAQLTPLGDLTVSGDLTLPGDLTPAIQLDALRETVDDVARTIRESLVYVYERDKVILGSLCLSPLISTAETRYQISRFVVDPQYQEQGIGRALFAHVIDELSRLTSSGSVLTVQLFTALSNRRKCAFYERFGFLLAETTNDRGYARGRFELHLTH